MLFMIKSIANLVSLILDWHSNLWITVSIDDLLFNDLYLCMQAMSTKKHYVMQKLFYSVWSAMVALHCKSALDAVTIK